MNRITTTVFFLLCFSMLMGQEGLSLQEALEIALERNYDILISQNNTEIADNDAIPGQADLLPTLEARGSIDYGLDNTRIQVTESPEIIETAGAQSWNYNASVVLTYTIFSGLRNINSFNQLKINADLSDAVNLVNIENMVLQVSAAYYNLMRTRDNSSALKESIQISSRRYVTAKDRKELSGGSNLEVLNSRVSLNQDSVSLLNAIKAVKDAEIELNRLMGRELDIAVETTEELSVVNEYDFMILLEELMEQNKQLLAARLEEQASLMNYRIVKSAYYPELNVSTSYSYNKSDAEGSFLELNESNGLGVNLSLRVPIYYGGARKASVSNSRLRMENVQLEKENLELTLESHLRMAYSDYYNTKTIVEKEELNVRVAESNFEYSEERFRLGQLSNIQFREAQVNLLLTRNNLNNERYNLRLIELELLRLSGRLVQEQ